MKTITIRVVEDIYNQIESIRGDLSKSDFYRAVIQEYINMLSDDNIRKQNEYAQLQSDYNTLQAVHEVTAERVADLQIQNGFMLQQFEYMRPQIAQKSNFKTWFNKMIGREI